MKLWKNYDAPVSAIEPIATHSDLGRQKGAYAPPASLLRILRSEAAGLAFVQLVKNTERTSASTFLEALIAAVPYKSSWFSPTNVPAALCSTSVSTIRPPYSLIAGFLLTRRRVDISARSVLAIVAQLL